MQEIAVFGLGNPPLYNGTRHNIGAEIAGLLLKGFKKIFRGKFCEIYAKGKRRVIKSRVYMNNSGLAFAEAHRNTRLSVGNILVVCDDFNLPLGKIRYRMSGSDGGHNGLRSIIESSGKDFPRLRIGIGEPSGVDPSDFVLAKFGAEEISRVEKAKKAAVGWIEKFWDSGWAGSNLTIDVQSD
ncbi:MAG: aminoacyl-tRNA hydrolase [Elusimicrobia bacterium]|nr:aminoacyl-tRNA hydrolase [Elusimicrobiota bacterium]